MPRKSTPPEEKAPELVEAERRGYEALRRYVRREMGVQAALSRETGIAQPVLTRMSQGRNPISVEQAMRLAVATKGELPAPMLCPSGAELLAKYSSLHMGRELTAQPA
jgi:DNA-binding transcriptional regulator YdaS (Cro superfamily)